MIIPWIVWLTHVKTCFSMLTTLIFGRQIPWFSRCFEVRTLKELHKLATMMATCMRRVAFYFHGRGWHSTTCGKIQHNCMAYSDLSICHTT